MENKENKKQLCLRYVLDNVVTWLYYNLPTVPDNVIIGNESAIIARQQQVAATSCVKKRDYIESAI